MKYIKIIVILCLVFFSVESFSQSGEDVEMADVLRREGKIYTVVLGVVTILTAMIILLIRVDRKLFKLEALFKKENARNLD
jgi:hypothetical protein